MKKFYFVTLCAVLLFVVTGCGNKNQVVCSASMNEGGMNIKAEVVGQLDKDNKISSVTVSYDLGSKESADQYCQIFKMMENSEKGIKVNCSGSKVIVDGLASMDVDAEDEEDKVIGLTKEEFIKRATETDEAGVKFTCK